MITRAFATVTSHYRRSQCSLARTAPARAIFSTHCDLSRRHLLSRSIPRCSAEAAYGRWFGSQSAWGINSGFESIAPSRIPPLAMHSRSGRGLTAVMKSCERIVQWSRDAPLRIASTTRFSGVALLHAAHRIRPLRHLVDCTWIRPLKSLGSHRCTTCSRAWVSTTSTQNPCENPRHPMQIYVLSEMEAI